MQVDAQQTWRWLVHGFDGLVKLLSRMNEDAPPADAETRQLLRLRVEELTRISRSQDTKAEHANGASDA